MIYTRFGTPVTITGYSTENKKIRGENIEVVWVKIMCHYDNSEVEREVKILELCSDDDSDIFVELRKFGYDDSNKIK